MSTRAFALAASVLVIAAPLRAQPEAAPGAEGADKPAAIAPRELEQKIGGRTTLELKFQDLTAEEASAALAKASGLRFGEPGPRRRVSTGSTISAGQAEMPLYNAEVAKMDFWPAVRAWSRAEAARMKREREALQLRQSEEKPPPVPTAPQGQEVAPEVLQAWQAEHNEWFRRRSRQMQRFDFDGGVGVHFDSNLQDWSLISGDQIGTGHALDAWPCLILATGFGRSQNLSFSSIEAGQKPQPQAEERAGERAGDAAPIAAPDPNGQGAVEGGHLTDSLSLGLSVYIEPKLLERAKVQLQVDEARDDAGEDLLPERAKGAGGRAHLQWKDQFIAGLQSPVSLRPRQARGKKLAVLRGVILVRYPMQLKEHEIADLSGPQGFALGTADLPAPAQFQPPRFENGRWHFGASVVVDSSRGGRALKNDFLNRLRRGDVSHGALGQFLLPNECAFTDSQGRIWRSNARTLESLSFSLKGPDGKIVPQTSPPTPPPDNFTYTEDRSGIIQLAPPSVQAAAPGSVTMQLSAEELAKVRFTKAIFITESDWRTLEIPFEFRDLPLPPR